ncbi:MAG TPA: peptide ABC transporter substrate-binding protein [Opitutales bacterium]|jgi:oligopeptide transport system substrate-binding protein|nr:peptide ABC transporter substrate-binding protein [Opitutales bacterium]
MSATASNLSRIIAAVGVCVLALTLCACGRRETPVEIANREGILLVSSGGDPTSIDPQLIETLNDSHISVALFEGLTVPDPVTLEPRPGVATSWEYDDKTLTWTFHLRPEAKWSNGDPLVAGDFVFSFQRMLTPELGADYANMLYPIKNAKAFNDGTLKDFSQVGVKAIDDHTLQIQLEHPTGYFLELCYHQTYLPVHPPTIKKFDAMARRDSGWDKPESFVGNGPFVLTKYVLGDVVEVKKNPLYWNAAAIRLNGIRFYPIADVNAEERAFRNGALHITSTLPPPRIPAYRDTHSPYLRVMPVYGSYFYTINTRKEKGALNDPRVRLALNMAIDRQALVDHVTRGGQIPSYTMTPPSAQYQPRAHFTEDVAAAQKLLAEAGYPGGKGIPPIELLYNTSDAHRAVAEYLQAAWKKNLGVDVHLANTAVSAWLDRRHNADFDIIRAGWYGDYLDPSTFLELFASDNEMEQSGWKSDKYDAFIADAQKESDPAKRMEDFQQAEAILDTDAPIIPLYYYTTIILIRPEVRGYENNLLDQHLYTNVYLDPTATTPEPQQ